MKEASSIVLLGTGDWTEVYIDGKRAGVGGHTLSDYDWADIIKLAQPIGSIAQREFISRADDEYWPYSNEWPQDLTGVPESELQEAHFLLGNPGLKLDGEPGQLV